jgi:hypothetical protein
MDEENFYKNLLSSMRERRSLFAPAEERRALLAVLNEALKP